MVLTESARTLGFIDVGTNSVRLMVARVDPNHTWTTITLQKEPVRLGEGEFADGRLQADAMERATVVCRTFVELARAHGAAEIVAVATAATREATNQRAFLRKLRNEAGLDVHVVSGKEEARLVFLGVLTKVHLDGRRALVIDIGGGSTELALGDAAGATVMDSLKLGAIRLTSEFPEAAGGPISREVWRRMRQRVRVASERGRRAVRGQEIDIVFGTSGTIRNLAAITTGVSSRRPLDHIPLRRADLRSTAKLLRSSDVAARRTIPGLNPERADIIVAGAAILDALMQDLGVYELHALSECGVRAGLVLDYLGRAGTPNAATLQVRERSILQLARSLGVDETHGRQVAQLATELFDTAASCGLHAYGAPERQLLWYAALLHDAGTFLSYGEHHVHSHYLIRNADLLGFDQQEVAMMATLALFHRRGRPRSRHPALGELDPGRRRAVRCLSVYLRIAEYLDRSHSGSIEHVVLRRNGRRKLALDVTPAKDWHLERWRLEDRRSVLEEMLGSPLSVYELRPDGSQLRETARPATGWAPVPQSYP
jgi:exopolyphosphatase/guanosine-5'-triphosphate,3'-diphosphate pyrophosphatase